MTRHEPGAEYDGPATLTDDTGCALQVEVKMRGEFQPLDGHFHWWGRLVFGTAADALQSGTTVRIDTGHGVATGRLSDLDPWGRYRIAGLGKPPF